jgi:opacity protein-like surface antigen/outer membrane protease
VSLVLAAGSANAADLAPVLKGPPPLWSWSGFYLGAHVGGGYGRTNFSDPFGASVYGDAVDTPFFLVGGQVGFNWQSGRWVFGIEADASGMASDGTNTCLAFSGFFVSANCHANPRFMGTLAGRVGMALGRQGHTLVYVKGGGAMINDRGEVTANNNFVGFFPQFMTNFSTNRVGGIVGAGVEEALSPAWSVNFEYNYVGVNGPSVTTPPSTFFQRFVLLTTLPANTTNVTSSFHVAKIGLNYHFGADPWAASWYGASGPVAAYPIKGPPPIAWAAGWSFEAGSRVWLSTGKFQWDNSLAPLNAPVAPPVLLSRLTYDKLAGVSGELFSRVDSPWNIFVKGIVGVGTFTGGKNYDEDWGVLGHTSYSNTLSDERNGKIAYLVADAGYDILRGETYKVGVFGGWIYYTERSDTYGCTQFTNPFGFCVPGIPTAQLIGTQDTEWSAPRIGISAEAWLWKQWRLQGDIAYSPWVNFTGRDNHLARATTTFFDQSGSGGGGVQIEGILSYFVTPAFSVGVGARYWAFWTNNDSTYFCTGCNGAGTVFGPEDAKYSAQRYGAFLQAAYQLK